MLKMKFRRLMLGKSQYVLANETGIFQSRLTLLERGFVKPRPHERKKLARALNLSEAEIDEIISEENR